MLIAAGGHAVSSTEHGGKKEEKKKKIKVRFSLFENKIHHSEIRILI